MAAIPAKLALEDGTVYTGRAFGAAGEATGEAVFNTSMTGYQEVLTDPSYKGQIVAMTYPLIGNYGVNADDRESGKPQVEGFVVRELTRMPSNFRSQGSLDDYLRDTRRHRPGGHRHPRPGPPAARARRHERRAVHRRSRRRLAGPQGPHPARHRRPRSGARGRAAAAVRLERRASSIRS